MTEAVTLAEAKQHLRVTSDGEDALIADLIVTSREWVEGRTGHLLVQRQMVQTFPAFSPYLDLRAWPIVSVDSVTYLDTAGASQALAPAGYVAFYGQRPARITAAGGWWPTAARGAVTVTVTAGYTAEAVPKTFKQAVKSALTGFYDNRDGLPDDIAKRIDNLLFGKRLRRL